MDLTQIDKIVTTIIFVLNFVIKVLTIPILIIVSYATLVRLVESVYQLRTQPHVKTIWAKILQIINNYASVEQYKNE